MRTTLSLDDDVAAALGRLREQRRMSHKQLVNEALRIGLARLEQPEPARQRRTFTDATSLGKPRLPDVDDVSETLALVEGDRHR
jgi:hypothetical protein